MGVERYEDGWCDMCGPETPHSLVNAHPFEDLPDGLYQFVECEGCGVRYYTPRYKEDVWIGMLKSDKQFVDAQALEETGQWPNLETPHSPAEQIHFVKSLYWRLFSDAMDLCEMDRPVNRFLDVGCHVGWAMKAATEVGLVSCGIDVDGPALHYASAKGKSVQQARLLETSFTGPFDMILMNDMIEHTFTPFQDLRKALELCSVGGVLILKTFAEDLPGSEWYQALGHEWHWTQTSLRTWIERAGWVVVKQDDSPGFAQVTFFCVRRA